MKQSWLDKLEKKIGWLRVPGLMRYIIAIQLVGAFIGVFAPAVYNTFLALNFSAIVRGQVWRLVTFVFYPSIDSLSPVNILLLAIELYLYYMIGNTLENIWGTFRFTLYYVSGYLLSIVAAFLVFVVTGFTIWPAGFDYVNQSLFLAFAVIFPDMEFLLYFILPVKAKWFALIYAGIMVYDIFAYVATGNIVGYVYAAAIVISMLNFLVFFLSTRNLARYSPKQTRRRRQFRQAAGTSDRKSVKFDNHVARHRCAICGRTEKDNADLEFRFCSKCEGNYEYCSDHIFAHVHVKKNPQH